MKNKLLNQIFVCLAIIGILIPCFIVPAAADAVDKSTVDILPAVEYAYGINDDSLVSGLSTPRQYFNSVNAVRFRWRASFYDQSYQGFCFTIYVSSGVAPAAAYVAPYLNSSYYKATLTSSNGPFYQYYINLTSNISYFEIKVEWSSSYSGIVSVRDCFGVVADVYNISNVAFRQVRHTDVSGVDSYSFVTQSNTIAMPYSKDYSVDSLPFYDQVNIGITQARLNYRYLDSCSILVGMPYADAVFSAYVTDSLSVSDWASATVYKVLNVEQDSSHTTRLSLVDGRYQVIYYYTVTADLTDVDMNGKMIHFSFDCAPVDGENLLWTLFYATSKPSLSSPPWYQVFYNWIKGFWDGETNELESSISSAANNIILGFNNSMHSISNGTSTQNNQVSGDVGKLEGGSDQLGQLTQDMQVEKPEIFAEDVSIDALVPQAGMNLIAAPILTIWDSPTVVSILLLVVTLILVSFVFFGKKG